MNERIKTLCQEAFTEAHESRIGPDGLVRSDGNPYIFYEKFAELLIQECINKIENEAIQYAEPVWAFELVNDIKEHFGVEP
jgi:hypothetical protein